MVRGTTMRGLRLVVWDRTALSSAKGVPWLTLAWWVGVRLYRALGRIDASHGATSWSDALAWLAEVSPGRAIDEVQFWGHGRWGVVLIAQDRLDARALEPSHPLHGGLVAVRERMRATSQWWFRTCETFGRTDGHQFAQRWTRFFGCRAAGHTYVIGAWQSGLHTLRPDESPTWSVDEGLTRDDLSKGAPSSPGAPNTITCLHGAIPDGW